MGQPAHRVELASIMPPSLARTFGVGRVQAPVLATGIESLDAALGGGFPQGAISEIISKPGHGGDWLALRAMLAAGTTCAVLDHDGSFHPPGAAALGLDLSRLLVVRESRRKEALWALERLAREPGLAVVLASLPELTDTMLRRLQLAAESSGQVLLLMQPEAARASWGALRLKVRGEPGDGRRRLLVEVLRARGGRMPRPVRIEINDDFTGTVRASSVLSHGKTDAQPRKLA
jgi:recombination protein RecA